MPEFALSKGEAAKILDVPDQEIDPLIDDGTLRVAWRTPDGRPLFVLRDILQAADELRLVRRTPRRQISPRKEPA